MSMQNIDLSHLIGKKVGSCTLLKEIGRGGMAAVFVAFQSTLKRQVALKILPKVLLTKRVAALFQQEAELTAILSHPNIIPIYEVGDETDFLFITMQLVQGKPLSHHIRMAAKNIIPSRRTLPLAAVMNVTMSVLDAMEYAHSQNIIHRDLKPANILIEEHSKRPLVVDFGTALLFTGHEDESIRFVGTPKYMSPEQLRNPQVDRRSDLYAIATMMLEMLSPEPLFPGIGSLPELIKYKLDCKDYPFKKKPSEMNLHLTGEMDRILFKAIAYEPDQRYATCREFKNDLERYQKEYL